jgi:hypothetical protein
MNPLVLDRLKTSQSNTPIEKSVLIVYIKKIYNAGFPLAIRHFNEFANKFLRMRNSIDTINKNWYINFFRRYPKMYTLFSRFIDHRRINAEDLNKYIE